MDITLLKAAIFTLNRVEVKGKENMEMLLGCIDALETFAQTLEKRPLEEAENG